MRGRSWTAAALPRDQRTDFGWRLWSYRWTPRARGRLHRPGSGARCSRQHPAPRAGMESLGLSVERRATRQSARGSRSRGWYQRRRPPAFTASGAQEFVSRLSRRGRHSAAAPHTGAVGRRDQQDGRAGARRCRIRIAARCSTTLPRATVLAVANSSRRRRCQRSTASPPSRSHREFLRVWRARRPAS